MEKETQTRNKKKAKKKDKKEERKIRARERQRKRNRKRGRPKKVKGEKRETLKINKKNALFRGKNRVFLLKQRKGPKKTTKKQIRRV